MISAEMLVKIYQRNLGVIKMQVKGLTHADSLLQPPFRANCLNWVIGHVAVSRQSVLKWLDLPQDMQPDEIAVYTRDSEAITAETEGVLTLERLLEIMEDTQRALNEGIAALTEEELGKVMNEKGTRLVDRLEFFAWHEGYHTGQMELLRQLAGTDDKVI